MYILLTNDDGFDSDGLLALKRALEEVAEVMVIAPDRNWSAAGHTKTMDKPLRVAEVRLADGGTALVTDGTPSDCVSLGVLGVLERKPDFVVSGINKGANLGEDITYSGTVAAAMEAAIAGIPGIAVSLAGYSEWDFSFAAHFAARLVDRLQRQALPREVVLNVNVPNVPREKIGQVEITRLGKRIYREVLIERKDPLGGSYYWLGGEPPSGIADEGTDFKAVTDNNISITPIHLDLTDHRLIEDLRRLDLRVAD